MLFLSSLILEEDRYHVRKWPREGTANCPELRILRQPMGEAQVAKSKGLTAIDG
jgi:hypothetical protein